MAPKLAQAVAREVFDSIPEQDLRPELGLLRGPLEELEGNDFLSQQCFLQACSTLRQDCEKYLKHCEDLRLDPDVADALVMSAEHALDVLSVGAMEESLVAFGWQSGEGGSLVFTGAREDLKIAVRQIEEVEAWVRRRGLHLVTGQVAEDNEGKSEEFHHPKVLLGFNKFKGAVWHISHRSCRPDGVLTFHNSPFSNFHFCGSGVRILHHGLEMHFTNTEAIIMAFKLHLVLGFSLLDALSKMLNIRESSNAKKEASSEIARQEKAADWTWWSCHGMHVLVGAIACLPKFLQDDGLQRVLLSTESSVLVEAAPHDGNWGVGSNSYDFFCQDEPAYYSLKSRETSELSFMKRDGSWSKRPKCMANALGKALMVVRAVICTQDGMCTEPMELQHTLKIACKMLKDLDVPFDWRTPGKHLLNTTLAN